MMILRRGIGHGRVSKMASDFSKRMNEIYRNFTKEMLNVSEESFQPTRTLGHNGQRLPKRPYNRALRQTAFGVSARAALAIKFDLDPWALKSWEG